MVTVFKPSVTRKGYNNYASQHFQRKNIHYTSYYFWWLYSFFPYRFCTQSWTKYSSPKSINSAFQITVRSRVKNLTKLKTWPDKSSEILWQMFRHPVKLTPVWPLRCLVGTLPINLTWKTVKWQIDNNLYRISSPISLVIFSVSDAEILVIFHEKRSSTCSQGFGIQKQFLNSVVLLFFADNTSSVGRSLTFRVSAYRWRNTVVKSSFVCNWHNLLSFSDFLMGHKIIKDHTTTCTQSYRGKFNRLVLNCGRTKNRVVVQGNNLHFPLFKNNAN